MAKGRGQTLTINFRGDEEDPPEGPRCPPGYSGLVPALPKPPEPPTPPTPTVPEPRMSIAVSSSGAGRGSVDRSGAEDGRPRVELTINFGPGDECQKWADNLCWRPSPFDYLNLLVTRVIYDGVYEQDEALPTVSGYFDSAEKRFLFNEIEDEDGNLVKPTLKVMWPTGDLSGYVRMHEHSNDWYAIDYRIRKEPNPPLSPQDIPDMWVTLSLPGDSKTAMGDPIYGWRIPVRFTLAEGLVEPGPSADAYGDLYEDLTSPDKAFQPKNTGSGGITVANPPGEGEEEWTAPGIDFTEEGVTAFIEAHGPMEESEYTLMMEVLPAYGRFELHGKFRCADEVRDLHGVHSMNRAQSNFLNYSLIQKPVAYLKLDRERILFIVNRGGSMADDYNIYFNGAFVGKTDFWGDNQNTATIITLGGPPLTPPELEHLVAASNHSLYWNKDYPVEECFSVYETEEKLRNGINNYKIVRFRIWGSGTRLSFYVFRYVIYKGITEWIYDGGQTGDDVPSYADSFEYYDGDDDGSWL